MGVAGNRLVRAVARRGELRRVHPLVDEVIGDRDGAGRRQLEVVLERGRLHERHVVSVAGNLEAPVGELLEDVSHLGERRLALFRKVGAPRWEQYARLQRDVHAAVPHLDLEAPGVDHLAELVGDRFEDRQALGGVLFLATKRVELPPRSIELGGRRRRRLLEGIARRRALGELAVRVGVLGPEVRPDLALLVRV